MPSKWLVLAKDPIGAPITRFHISHLNSSLDLVVGAQREPGCQIPFELCKFPDHPQGDNLQIFVFSPGWGGLQFVGISRWLNKGHRNLPKRQRITKCRRVDSSGDRISETWLTNQKVIIAIIYIVIASNTAQNYASTRGFIQHENATKVCFLIFCLN